MRLLKLILFSFSLTILALPALAQYEGGDNDGSGSSSICISTLDGTGLFSFGALTGSSTFCEMSSEGYTIALNNPPADIDFYWTVPAGAVVLSGQDTPSVSVLFGSTAGDVIVTVVTGCSSTTFTMPVTNGVCTMYGGGDNDGATSTSVCISTLDGIDQFSFGALSGSPTFCEFSSEGYSIGLNNPPADMDFYWTVPAGATILSGQDTPSINVLFGNTSGDVSVTVITGCTSATFMMTVTSGVCTMYDGGDNDGFSQTPSCATDLNGGAVYSVTGITGSSAFCEFGTESFTAITTNAPANTYYTWTVPADATITSGQGTATILVTFGNTSGDVTVVITTDCSVITPAAFPVVVSACSFYAGGDNDGFSTTFNCAMKLDGTAALIPGPVIGSTTFCDFATESYSIVPLGTNIETTYFWTVPAGAVITSGQGTTSILVTFGNAGGSVSVDVTNLCQTINSSVVVATTNCIFYAGGDNDGFSNVQACAATLNGGSVFIPGPIVGPANSCEFSTESYSITVAGALSNAVYLWSVPAGASIISGQGTTTILVAFGNTSGNVSVAVSNECSTVNASQPIAIANCIFYAGGDNDGFSFTQQCASNLNGGSVFIPGPVVGVANSCSFSTESYSITVAGALANTVYFWSVPAGASIISGQGTSSILVAFGSSSGNVSIAISNECSTVNASLPVTIANCIFYAGGDNDGFSWTRTCATNLNGGSQFIPGTITGTATFCNFSSESYSIAVAGANSTTTYTWTVPAGAAIVNGQGTNTILVSFGNTNGNVAVAVANECETINVTTPVTGTSCIFYAGGNGDGFAVTTITNSPLPITLVSFDATVENGIVYLKWQTSSEIDNDFFLVERSSDGQTFEPLAKVDGAGTSHQKLNYQSRDTNPYHGTSYYRLSQTDFDGSVSYFRVLIVKIESFGEVTKLYPNPVDKDSQLHIDYFAEEDGQVKISIVDPAGIGSASNMIDVKAGVNLFEFTPHFKSAGVHIVIIRSKEKAQAIRLVVL